MAYQGLLHPNQDIHVTDLPRAFKVVKEWTELALYNVVYHAYIVDNDTDWTIHVMISPERHEVDALGHQGWFQLLAVREYTVLSKPRDDIDNFIQSKVSSLCDLARELLHRR